MLRLEAGLLLAGQDFDAGTNPIEAGLDFAVSWDHEFVGKAALERSSGWPAPKKLIGLHAGGPDDPSRTDTASGPASRAGPSRPGNYSPVLECGIGLGYLLAAFRGRRTRSRDPGKLGACPPSRVAVSAQ